MQLESLKIFCDVVRWASFSRGARENGISQSSASQVVHQLEVRLGVKLIDRSKRPLVPTAQGKVYYEGCKDLVGRYLEVESRVKALEDDHKLAGTVRVASIYSVGLHHMSRYVERFRAEYPGAEVRVEYLHPTRVIEVVLGDDAELGLISFPRKWPELAVVPWREEEMVLAVHPGHPLANAEAVGVEQLDGETFVGFDPELPIRRAVDRFLRKHGIHVRVALEFDNIETIKRAVEVPAGVAILPAPTLAGEVRAGTLRAVRFRAPRPTRPLAIIHRRSEPLGLAASRFLALLTAAEGPSPSASALASASPLDAKTTTLDSQARGSSGSI
jgi:DNA-binding transcriptional LysR family regulator